VDLRAESPGRVERVYFEDGAHVRRGDRLVALRDVDARASLDEARARWNLAKLDHERARALVATGDLARAELDRAAANEALARAAVDRANEDLRRTILVAPLDGVLGRRQVSPGQFVDPSVVLARLEVIDPILIEAAFPEGAVGQIAVAQAARVDIPGAEPREGRVTFVAPRLDPTSRTLPVRVTLENTNGTLVSGMTARLRLTTERRTDALLVPTHAVSPSAKGPAVWIVAPDQTVQLSPVVLGQRQESQVEVVDGVKPGESVVIEGLARLRPGAPVKVLP
jgi:membrane fusion protein (multidrug efflux system)